MKKCGRNFKANSSGQLLIIAALAIAILISSTTIYIYELSTEKNSANALSISDFVFALKHGTKNTMISSLANVSIGGEKTTLTTNLNMLSHIFKSLNNFGICHLAFTPRNDSNYEAGIWLSWNTSDVGISSAYTNFTLTIYGVTAEISVVYAINITTVLVVNGSCTALESGEKLVNLTCNLYNEDEPALAKNIALFYENLGSWVPVNESNNLSILDYGNGTHVISFILEVPSDTVEVLVQLRDLREIFVQTSTTCSES